MLPRKILENVHDLMAVLVLFVEFSAKFCFNFLTLNLSASPNMMHFVRAFLIYACLLLSRRLEIMKQLYTSKTFSKTAGGRRHTPHPTP